MKIFKINIPTKEIYSKLLYVFGLAILVTLFAAVYFLGLIQGFVAGGKNANNDSSSVSNRETLKVTPIPTIIITQRPTQIVAQQQVPWGGPQLWDEVNKRRQELGVNPLNQRDELCTISSIRLNELLELDKLDGHEGFSNMRESRPDLEWIFERYSTIAEFLAVGGKTPEETVSLWENTLGHKKLLTGGEYVWGCIYSQDTFAVAITAF